MLEVNDEIRLLQFATFQNSAVAHGVTTRAGGVSEGAFATLNLSLSSGDDPSRIRENRARLARSLGFEAEAMVTTPQVHGADVLVVDDENFDAAADQRADILVTKQPGILLMHRFADCVPLLLWDEAADVVGVAHAGWRGTQKGVAERAVNAVSQLGGRDPAEIRAAIGPSIGPCCFEVGHDVAQRFPDAADALSMGPLGRPHLNLWELNRRALVAAGVPRDRIEVAGECTKCAPDTFFSHRALGYPAGRFGAAIGLRSSGVR